MAFKANQGCYEIFDQLLVLRREYHNTRKAFLGMTFPWCLIFLKAFEAFKGFDMLRQLELAQHYQTLLNLYCNKLRIKKVRICKRRHDLVHDEGNFLKVISRYAFWCLFDSEKSGPFLSLFIHIKTALLKSVVIWAILKCIEDKNSKSAAKSKDYAF